MAFGPIDEKDYPKSTYEPGFEVLRYRAREMVKAECLPFNREGVSESHFPDAPRRGTEKHREYCRLCGRGWHSNEPWFRLENSNAPGPISVVPPELHTLCHMAWGSVIQD